MEADYTKRVNLQYLLSGFILTFLLLNISINVSAQSILPQPCSQNQSWIPRWTIRLVLPINKPSYLSGSWPPGLGSYIYYSMDGDTTSVNSTMPFEIFCSGANHRAPWKYNVDFGTVRHLTQIKLFTDSMAAPHTYQIYIGLDTSNFTLIKSGILPFSKFKTEKTIDFNGYYDARYVKFITLDTYGTFNSFSYYDCQIWEINYFQCGVDPFYAKQTISPTEVTSPVLSCTDAISKDIQGVINTYFPGQKDAFKGSNTVEVDMAHARGEGHTFISGDRVLIMQMQNSIISDTNSLAYGDGNVNDLIASGWKDVRNTGEYEFAIVGSVSGNTIQLTQPLQKSYYADGAFQIVYCPIYDNVTLKGTVKAADWDGFSGGIVTFDARTLNLNNQSIDVSAQGFRKGNTNPNLYSSSILYYWADYCTDNKTYFGEKGEGIAGAPSGSYSSNAKRLYSIQNTKLKSGGSFGRGAPGNAGGGGASLNSGGGGGANIGSGGQGGASYGYTSSGDMTKYWDVPSPNGGPPKTPGYWIVVNGNPVLTAVYPAQGYYPNGGMGGAGNDSPDAFRLWMGGAGGGGHQDSYTGTSGGNGGGIILTTARTVKGQGNLLANGASAENAVMMNGLSDGAGGGGAGGIILFGFTDQSSAKISYSVKGGNGGSITNSELHGPGGGGGGGAIIISAPPTNGTTSVTGGKNGVHIPTGSQWGANEGLNGKTLINNNLSTFYTYTCDHGDAPLSFGDPAHQLKPGMPSLGTPGDAESFALNQPPHDLDALGDDLTGINDEDGIVQPLDTTLSTGQSRYSVTLLIKNPNNSSVNLCGWIDYNCNGLFEDNEKVSISGVLNGPTDLVWNNFPPDIIGGDSYMRFRVSTGIEALKPTGVSPDGEVEDYFIYINGFPAAVKDDTCTHESRPVNILVVKNDNIHGDKRGKISILRPPLNGIALISNNNTPDDKRDDFITYTPNPGFQGIDTLTYELWNNVGNSAKAKVTITVKEPLIVDFKTNPSEGCTPLTINFQNLSSDPNAKYDWNFGDYTTNSKAFEPQHIYKTGDSTSIYNIILRMNTGCGISETTKQIIVYPLPHAIMTLQSNDEKPELVILTDISPKSVSRIWTIDGLIMGKESQIRVKFDSIGPHTISLRVFNAVGCSDDATLIHTTVFKGLYVPNAFIPESKDPLVNTFKPVGYGIKEYTLMIFDLWGNLIWSDSQLSNLGQPLKGWDGKDKNGKPLPTDAYIWRIKAIMIGNKPWKGMEIPLHSGTYHTEGTLTIIR